jgi:hypothetical protein
MDMPQYRAQASAHAAHAAQLSAHVARTRVGPFLRRYVRKLWEKRGGGFYGFVATMMFLYLEVVDIAGDIIDLGGARPSLGWLISFVVSNLVTLVINTVRAAIWPLTWLSQFGVGVLSATLLAGAYLAYRAVRPHVLRMLAEPDGDEDASGAMSAQPTA